MDGISSDELMKSLSDDAKVLLGGYFGDMAIPGRSKLVFAMRESKPTARAQTALDELVAARAMERTQLEGGAVEYVVQINCSDFGRWMGRNKSKGKWSATEPVSADSTSRG